MVTVMRKLNRLTAAADTLLMSRHTVYYDAGLLRRLYLEPALNYCRLAVIVVTFLVYFIRTPSPTWGCPQSYEKQLINLLQPICMLGRNYNTFRSILAAVEACVFFRASTT